MKLGGPWEIWSLGFVVGGLGVGVGVGFGVGVGVGFGVGVGLGFLDVVFFVVDFLADEDGLGDGVGVGVTGGYEDTGAELSNTGDDGEEHAGSDEGIGTGEGVGVGSGFGVGVGAGVVGPPGPSQLIQNEGLPRLIWSVGWDGGG